MQFRIQEDRVFYRPEGCDGSISYRALKSDLALAVLHFRNKLAFLQITVYDVIVMDSDAEQAPVRSTVAFMPEAIARALFTDQEVYRLFPGIEQKRAS